MPEPEKPSTNLALRLGTAAVTVPLLLYSLLGGPLWLFPLLTEIVCALGAHELFTMVAPKHPLARIWGVAASIVLCAQVGGMLDPAWTVPVFVTVVSGGLLTSLIRVEPMPDAASRAAWSVAGPLYLGVLFGTIAALFLRPHGGEWVVLTMLYAFWSDTGRLLRRARLRQASALQRGVAEEDDRGIDRRIARRADRWVARALFGFCPAYRLLDAILLSLDGGSRRPTSATCASR